MTKELIWAVLALALILTTYISHVEDRRHKEAIAKLEARRLEVQTRMRELDLDALDACPHLLGGGVDSERSEHEWIVHAQWPVGAHGADRRGGLLS